MTAYYAVNYDGNSLLMFLCRLSARSSPLTFAIYNKKPYSVRFFVVLVPKAGQRNRHVFFYRFSLSVEKRSDYRRPLAFPKKNTPKNVPFFGDPEKIPQKTYRFSGTPNKGSSPYRYLYTKKNRNEYSSFFVLLVPKAGLPRTLAYFNRAPENLNERSEARFLGKRSNRPKDETDKWIFNRPKDETDKWIFDC